MMTNEIKPIGMPKWGMEMSEGEINAWHVKVGDQVNIEDDLVDVETAKIVNTVTAADSGIVRAILAQPGETHNVGGLLGVLASADVSEDEIQVFISNYRGNNEVVVSEEAPIMSEVANESIAPTEKQLSNLAILAGGGDDSHVPASPVARRLAGEYGVNLNNIIGTGRHERVSKGDLEAAVTAAGGLLIGTNNSSPSKTQSGDDSQVKATPVARRLAEQLGINLLDCRVSGDRGRVCKADVEAAAAMKNKLPAYSYPSSCPW
jgi:pyruvate dehydrogenase E2 component (dihydrolipoamide acetyltransferase)